MIMTIIMETGCHQAPSSKFPNSQIDYGILFAIGFLADSILGLDGPIHSVATTRSYHLPTRVPLAGLGYLGNAIVPEALLNHKIN